MVGYRWKNYEPFLGLVAILSECAESSSFQASLHFFQGSAHSVRVNWPSMIHKTEVAFTNA